MNTTAIQESEDPFRVMIEQAPVATCLFSGPEFRVVIANDLMISYWGKDRSVMGRTLIEALPELKGQQFIEILEEVYATGKPYSSKSSPAQLRLGDGNISTCYFDFTYQPLKDATGKVFAIMDVAVDVTQEIEARKQLQESELFASALIDHSPVAKIVVVGPEMEIKTVNQNMLSILGRSAEIIGTPFFQAVPELGQTPLMARMQKVFTTGETLIQPGEEITMMRGGQITTAYYNYIYKALQNTSGAIYGVMITATEVTGQVEARLQLEKEKQRADLAIELADVGVYEVDMITDEATVDDRFLRIMGVPDLGRSKEYVHYIHPDDLPIREEAYRQLSITGKFDYEARLVHHGQPVKWIRSTARQLTDVLGKPTRLIGLVQNITRQKAFEESLAAEVQQRTYDLQKAWSSLEASHSYLQVVINNFDTAFAALEPIWEDKKIIDFRFLKSNDAYSAYSKVPPAQIQNQPVSMFFPEYFKTEAFDKYVETFETGKENDWQLHYNVDGLDVHLEVNARRIGNEVIIQVIDFTTLKNLQADLLRKIGELQRSNRNLEEFAYAASHDLKEPIRKILFMSDLLYNRLHEQLGEKDQHLFKRMENAGHRMYSLVEDLLSYSQVNSVPELVEIELNDVLTLVLGDLELEIQQKKATVDIYAQCRLYGHSRQLQQVFHNLIGNALKYTALDRAPSIRIECKTMQGRDLPMSLPLHLQLQHFQQVAVSDNGIGFETADAERIFDVFTRLHGSDFVRGTGVGLAIVRKVMENHRGFIRAESAPGLGSTFYLYFPVA